MYSFGIMNNSSGGLTFLNTFKVCKNQLSISLSTFYKYVRVLGLKKYWPKAIAKTVGIVSTKPNQYLHVDTTFWEFSSSVKAAIVFVSDNYSKAILGWEVAVGNTSKNVMLIYILSAAAESLTNSISDLLPAVVVRVSFLIFLSPLRYSMLKICSCWSFISCPSWS